MHHALSTRCLSGNFFDKTDYQVDKLWILVTVLLMLFHPRTGEQIFHRATYVLDRPHDDWEDVSEWPDSDDESSAIRGYLDADEPREHFSFAHHIAVLDQEQIDYADETYERWLKYNFNKAKIEMRRETAKSQAAQHQERLDIGEFAKNSRNDDHSNEWDRVETDNPPVQEVPASHVLTSVNEKIQNIKDAYSMFCDGALTDQEFKELKRQILDS